MLISIIVALCVVALVITWIAAIWDMFRRKDMKAWQIVMWIAIVVIFPLLGLLAYFLFRPAAADVHYKDEVIQ